MHYILKMRITKFRIKNAQIFIISTKHSQHTKIINALIYVRYLRHILCTFGDP